MYDVLNTQASDFRAEQWCQVLPLSKFNSNFHTTIYNDEQLLKIRMNTPIMCTPHYLLF